MPVGGRDCPGVDTSWAMLFSSMLWPLVVLIVVMTVMLSQRKALGGLIGRINCFSDVQQVLGSHPRSVWRLPGPRGWRT